MPNSFKTAVLMDVIAGESPNIMTTAGTKRKKMRKGLNSSNVS
jgi:hypothetical protein